MPRKKKVKGRKGKKKLGMGAREGDAWLRASGEKDRNYRRTAKEIRGGANWQIGPGGAKGSKGKSCIMKKMLLGLTTRRLSRAKEGEFRKIVKGEERGEWWVKKMVGEKRWMR